MIYTDVAIIGAGAAGCEAALLASKSGMETCLIEKDKIGGVCLNRGCIPTKSYLYNSKELRENTKEVQRFTNEVVGNLAYGMKYSLQKSGVKLIVGEAVLCEDRCLIVNTIESQLRIVAKYIIIATGSLASEIVMPKAYKNYSIEQMFTGGIDENKITILGAGAVGIEAAVICHRMGKQVTVVEKGKQILPGMETELAERLMYLLEDEGIHFILNSTEPVDYGVLVCCGRKAVVPLQKNSNLLKLNKNGSICVDEVMQTSCKDIYAIGDCNGIRMEANVGMKQAHIVLEYIIKQKKVEFCNDLIPRCVYTPIEFVSVGMTEQDAVKEKGLFCIYYGDVYNIGAGKIQNEEYSLVKVISDRKTGCIKGVHMLCTHASEIAAFASLALLKQITVDEMKEMVYLHPSLSEVFGSLREKR